MQESLWCANEASAENEEQLLTLSEQTLKFTSDGTDRELRPIQREALNWIGDNWGPKKHLFAGLGVGAGKSMLLRTVQKSTGAHILTSQNILLRQYKQDYPELNDLMGGANYTCSEYLTKCNIGSTRYSCKGSPDQRCCYLNNRDRFIGGEPSILNLMSFYINSARYKVPSNSMLIDEAHTIPGLIRQITSTAVKFGPMEKAILKQLKYEKHELVSELKLCAFLRAKVDKLNALMAKEKDPDKLEKYHAAMENADLTLQGFESSPERYVVQFEEGTLRVLPLTAPRKFMDRIIGTNGVMTSGTLLPHDMRELVGGDSYTYQDFGTPIPAQNRQIISDPMPFGFSFAEIRPEAIADKIMDIYLRDPQPTMVHATYGMAQRLREFLFQREIIWHDKDTKSDAVDRFKKEGGILIGSGLSEGLDLKNDLCRRQIIIQLQFPNISDLFVKKRRALADGAEFYMGETFKTFAQQVGRSTRTETDWSQTIVLDSRFKNTYYTWKRMGFISNSFADSITWR